MAFTILEGIGLVFIKTYKGILNPYCYGWIKTIGIN
jgi:transposase